MKILVIKKFKYQHDARTVRVLQKGVYEVGKGVTIDVAELALSLHAAHIYIEPVVKKAPEKKVVEAPENKASLAKPSVRRGRSRPKSHT